MADSRLVVTREEGARVLANVARLDRAALGLSPRQEFQPVSAWDLYLLSLGQVAPGGSAKLFTADDLALARLFGRMRALGLARVARAALAFRQADLRAALHARTPHALVIRRGPRSAFQGAVVPLSDADDVLTKIPLVGLLTGLDAEMRAVRQAQRGQVWTGVRYENARTVASSLATEVLTV